MAKRKRYQQDNPKPAWPKSVVASIIIGVAVVMALLVTNLGHSSTRAISETATAPAQPAAVAPTATLTPAQFTPTATPSPTVAPEAPPTSSPPAENETAASQATTPQFYSYQVINTYPHDRAAFTQGLIYEDGILYEGTGLRGQSSLRKVILESGEVTQMITLPEQFFGEGITIFGDRIIQLTWQSRIGFVYDKESFELLQQFAYPTEGWGITHDDQQLIMSDGTANLYFWDPDTLAEIGRVEVRDGNEPVRWLNELEYINGEIYANIWKTTRIARISPETGQVLGWIELAGLLAPEDLLERVDVLNGIAYDAAGDRLFVTGKWWPKLFEIDLLTYKN